MVENAFLMNVDESLYTIWPKKSRTLFEGTPLHTKTQL